MLPRGATLYSRRAAGNCAPRAMCARLRSLSQPPSGSTQKGTFHYATTSIPAARQSQESIPSGLHPFRNRAARESDVRGRLAPHEGSGAAVAGETRKEGRQDGRRVAARRGDACGIRRRPNSSGSSRAIPSELPTRVAEYARLPADAPFAGGNDLNGEWWPFLKRARNRLPPSGILLALDPGDTTGYAIFEGGTFLESGQIPTLSPSAIADFVEEVAPDRVVCESYRIYGHKLREHSGSDVPTLQLIGAVRLVCERSGIPLAFQAAHQAKGFCSDTKLRQWGLFHPSSKHARDAARHGAYFLLFNKTSNSR